jgi:hypothetical protein
MAEWLLNRKGTDRLGEWPKNRISVFVNETGSPLRSIQTGYVAQPAVLAADNKGALSLWMKQKNVKLTM